MTAPAPTPGPTLRHAVVLYALAGLAAYFNSFQGAFVFDDLGSIVDPDIGRPLRGRLAARPVASLSFTLNYWLDGFNTRGYHLGNLLIHVGAAVVLFDLVRRTLTLPRFGDRYAASAGWVALVAGLLWLVHPLNTQAVTYLVQRCESLMGLLVLVSLRCYVEGVTTGERRWHVLAGVACGLASGCKEITLGVPALAALYDRTFLANSWREVLARWRPLAGLTAGALVGVAILVATGVLTDPGGTVGFGVPRFTPTTYALTQTQVIPHYLWLSVWPKDLCLDYLDWPAPSVAAAAPYLAGLAAALLATLVGVVRHAAWGFLLAWFFVILAPTSSVVPVQDPAFEHRMYLPLIAVVLAFVLAAERVLRVVPARAWIATAAVVALTVLLAGRTILRNEDYTSRGKLAFEVIRLRPDNARSRMVYASALLRAGRPQEALREVEIAARRPDLVPDFTLFGHCLQDVGRGAEAERVLRELVALKPTDPRRTAALASVLLVNGKAAAAEEQVRASLQAREDLAARVLLAASVEEQGRDATAEYAAARRLVPEGYVHTLSVTARRQTLDPAATPGQLRQALLDARAAVRLADHDDWEQWDTLAICYARGGDFARAAAAEERAIAAAASRTPYERQWLADRLALFRAGMPYPPPDVAP